jgi:hypothetical protein
MVNQTRPPRLQAWNRHVLDEEKPWESVFIDAADVDGDGYPDVLTGGWWYKNPGIENNSWKRNEFGKGANNFAIAHDFDKDGHADILATKGIGAEANGSFVWAKNNGAGSFTILDNIEDGDGDFLQGAAIHSSTAEAFVALSWHKPGMGVQALRVPNEPSTGTWPWQRGYPCSRKTRPSVLET